MCTGCRTRSRWTGSGNRTMNKVAADRYKGSALDRWITKRRLRAVSRVGAGARLQGRADIGGGGQIVIGDGLLLMSQPVRSHIFASPGSVISIGDGVQISYGAAIAAQRAVDIGSNTSFGPFVVIMDNDFHRVGNRDAAGEVAPVRIGSNVNVGARVTILRGSIIGDNVRIMSGSMVSGLVPSGGTVGGVPAREVISTRVAAGIDMADLVQEVLGLAGRPLLSDGPAQITAWDSLGSLRLLLAIEETYGISLEEKAMHAADTVAALSGVVAAKLKSSARTDVAVAELVQGVLGLSERPLPDEGPAQIAAWDSLGTLRLLLAIEETYGVSLEERTMHAANTVAALSAIVEAKRRLLVPTAIDRREPS
jgi:acetyltransferase-like isoleucine patch superfamily enzyme/acyl carrier protein